MLTHTFMHNTHMLTHSHTHTQLPHKVGVGIWSAGNKVQYKKTTDCIVGLSQQEFSTVINGLSAIIAELIRVSFMKCYCNTTCMYTYWSAARAASAAH